MTIYFTLVNIALVLFHRYTYKYYNLLLSSLIVSVLSLVYVYITPQQLDIKLPSLWEPVEFRLKGWKLRIGDLLAHHLVLLFVVVVYGDYYKEHKFGYATGMALLLVMLYAAFCQPRKVYRVEPEFAAWGVMMVMVLYLMV